MKKILLSAGLLTAAFSVNAADLHPACEAYFKDLDAYLEKAPAEMKTQMEQSKAQYAAIPAQAQEQACKQAQEQLKQLPKM